MNIKNIRRLILPACLALSTASFAAIIENFNSRNGSPITAIKGSLQKDCWTFQRFDVNKDGWNPRMEGDGAMVCSGGSGNLFNAAIYTPALAVDGNFSVAFLYSFNAKAKENERRWITMSLVNMNNQPVMALDSFAFQNTDAAIKRYANQFTAVPSGNYRLAIEYHSTLGSAKIAIDQLAISAPIALNGGCHITPKASDSRITGLANRKASGYLLATGQDSSRQAISFFLMAPSPHGNVSILSDGSFNFTPYETFKGRETHFSYTVCAAGSPKLCSENAKMTIYFPTADMTVAGLTGFSGAWIDNKNVELKWSTGYETQSNRYEIERSIDGKIWKHAGLLKGRGASDGSFTYAYMDKISRNIAFKKDLYYRLRQINEQGDAVYSRILVLRLFNNHTLNMISVTPDPILNDIALNIQLQETSFVTMRIVKDDGSLAIKKSVKLYKGANHINVDGSHELKPGDYVLEVIVNSKERMQIKLLKESSVVQR